MTWKDADKIIGRLLKSFDKIEDIDPGLVLQMKQSYMSALHDVFFGTAIQLLLSALPLRYEMWKPRQV